MDKPKDNVIYMFYNIINKELIRKERQSMLEARRNAMKMYGNQDSFSNGNDDDLSDSSSKAIS